MHYGYQSWSEVSLMQVYYSDDFYGGQRSSEVRCGKLCAIVIKTWSEESLMQVYDDYDLKGVKGHQRSNVVNYVLSLKLGQKNP